MILFLVMLCLVFVVSIRSAAVVIESLSFSFGSGDPSVLIGTSSMVAHWALSIIAALMSVAANEAHDHDDATMRYAMACQNLNVQSTRLHFAQSLTKRTVVCS